MKISKKLPTTLALTMKTALISVLLLGSGCASLQATGDKYEARKATGKLHADLLVQKELGFGIKSPLRYGPLVAEEKLENGLTIKKHVQRVRSGQGSSVAFSTTSYRYRIFYFLVDADDVIQDWALGSYDDDKSDWAVGGVISLSIESPSKAAEIEILDGLVRTSTGQLLSSWK
ncbi:hypothetical protein ACFLQY_04055 [Verrucomicrobiota bacterium]